MAAATAAAWADWADEGKAPVVGETPCDRPYVPSCCGWCVAANDDKSGDGAELDPTGGEATADSG